MKVSFIATVFNEEKTIEQLLESVFLQSKLPDEIIIVDGGSSDNTAEQIANSKEQMVIRKISFIFMTKKGNRAVGRNEAIKKASGAIVVCSDAGCILDKDWVKNITAPFIDASVDVVAGYYKGDATTIFQKCLIPYVLVMDDKVNEKDFLPASRSMAFRKKIWEKTGGFPEQYSHNEDYVLAQTLKKTGAKIVFAKDAFVYWFPVKSFVKAYIMFFRFAYGDIDAHIFRKKVFLLFLRYIIGIVLLLVAIIVRLYFLLWVLFIGLIIYLVWSIMKNYRYVQHWKAVVLLPVIQILSDVAVIMGSLGGFLKILWGIQKMQ